MQERLPLEHGSELVTDTPEKLLNSGRVAQEGDGHLETTGRNITLRGENVVGNPLDEVSRVLVLDVLHLFLDFFHRDLATKDSGNCEVTTVARVASSHHVLRIEHLLGKLGDGDSTVLLATTSRQRSETRKEEVQTREGHFGKDMSL